MPLEVFYSYAREDEKLRDEIEKNLTLLRRKGLIVGWSDRRVSAGGTWSDEIDAHVHSAQIILLLISADFLASDYCYGVELNRALERHARHEAIVIPIILRPVDWSGAPFAHLQALPRDARAVTTWENRDEAFADIARGIREVVHNFEPPASRKAAHPSSSSAGGLGDASVYEGHVMDGAIPSHVVKDRVMELQGMPSVVQPGAASARAHAIPKNAEAKPESEDSDTANSDLIDSWYQYDSLDEAAIRHQVSFGKLQWAILGLGIVATLLAIVRSGYALPQWLMPVSYIPAIQTLAHVLLVQIPIVILILTAASSRFREGNKWVLLRASAEAVKREIFRFRTQAGVYSNDQCRHTSREAKLAARLQDISSALAQSEVNRTSLPAVVKNDPTRLTFLSADDY
jgi:hypothetical protein